MHDCDMYMCWVQFMILLSQYPNFLVIWYFICLMFCKGVGKKVVWNTVITQVRFNVGLYGLWMKLWSKIVSWENEEMITLRTITVVMQIFRKMYVCIILVTGICYYLNLLFCLSACPLFSISSNNCLHHASKPSLVNCFRSHDISIILLTDFHLSSDLFSQIVLCYSNYFSVVLSGKSHLEKLSSLC